MRKFLCSLVFVLGLFSLILPHQVQAADTNTYSVNTKISFSANNCFQHYKDCTITIAINDKLAILTDYPIAKLPTIGKSTNEWMFLLPSFDWRSTLPNDALYATYTIFDKHKKVIASAKTNATIHSNSSSIHNSSFLYIDLAMTAVTNDHGVIQKYAVNAFSFEASEIPMLRTDW